MKKGSATSMSGTAGGKGTAPATIVLIAEDEQPIADALAMIVADAGYLPLVAPHGERALELARERPPAMVITDLMMPHMDGRALMRALREDAKLAGSRPPVIVLTTAAPFARTEWSLADAYLRKPFNIDEVEALLHRYLDAAAHESSRSGRKSQSQSPAPEL